MKLLSLRMAANYVTGKLNPRKCNCLHTAGIAKLAVLLITSTEKHLFMLLKRLSVFCESKINWLTSFIKPQIESQPILTMKTH